MTKQIIVQRKQKDHCKNIIVNRKYDKAFEDAIDLTL